MAVSDNLHRLSVKAKEAEDSAASAKTKAEGQLKHDVENAREKAQESADRLSSQSTTAASKASGWTAGIQQSWDDHVRDIRQRMDAQKAKHDARVAEDNAQDAEDYADFAIELAYSAIAQAEYAVLTAILLRGEADAIATTSPHVHGGAG